MNTNKLYLTTTLPYVNAAPHLGFALEIVYADIFARFHREILGEAVFMNTGTDEHGLKIFRKAADEGKEVQAYVDEYAAKFRMLKEKLDLSPDLHFIRTTDPAHVAGAREFWKRCAEHGDIYKKKYKGLYCVGDEAFVKEADLVDGRCPNHPTLDLVEIEEENYFFRLSAYQDKLLEYLSKPDSIVPEWRREEALNFVKQGLEDFSISRERARLPWGIPVPGDEDQVMYVWFDALTNYVTTLGWPEDKGGNFKKFWIGGHTLQLAGKDQVRFQSIMWQAMLMSAGLPTTERVMYHGFITSGGQKMSKSIGNVVDPYGIVERFGADALRYWLAREANTYEDSDFTMEKFTESYNANLANGLGNLVSRVVKMAGSNGIAVELPGPERVFSEVQADFDPFDAGIFEDLKNFELKKFMDLVWSLVAELDLFVQKEEPFRTIKTDRAKAEKDIRFLMRSVYAIGLYLRPVMPETSRKIIQAVREGSLAQPLFPRVS